MFAFRAGSSNRSVPADEITFRILVTAVEYTVLLRFAFYDFALLTFRTAHADRFDDRLRVAAVREIGAGHEFTLTAHLVYHRRSAFLAVFPDRLIFDLYLFHFFFRPFAPRFEFLIEIIDHFDP